MSFTYNEMKSQYGTLRRTYDYIKTLEDELLNFYYKEKHLETLTYIGCGSSYCLCQSAEFSAKIRLGIPSNSFAAGDLMLNYPLYQRLFKGTMLIALTRSGSTSEVLMAIDKVKTNFDVPLLAITCIENSDIARVADLTLELPWAFDESVCQTQTVTNLYAANLLVLAYLCKNQDLISDINTAINIGNSFIEKYENPLKRVAEEPWNNVVVLADGELEGLAREGALAFEEIARMRGSFCHLLDVRHGPMVLIDDRTLVVICLANSEFDYQIRLVNDLLKKGACVVTYSDLPIPSIAGVRLHVDSGKRLDYAVKGIPFIFIIQTLAYYKAVKNGVNPDQPEGLDAWIKL